MEKEKTIEDLIQMIESGLTAIRPMRANGAVVNYVIETSFGTYCYTGKTLRAALEKAVTDYEKG